MPAKLTRRQEKAKAQQIVQLLQGLPLETRHNIWFMVDEAFPSANEVRQKELLEKLNATSLRRRGRARQPSETKAKSF